MTTKHKDDKGEFEYVEVAIVTNPVETLYRKVYTQKQIDWSKVDNTVLVTGKIASVDPWSQRFSIKHFQASISESNLRFDTTILLANPGHCPLPEGVMVEVKYRDIVFTPPLLATTLRWKMLGKSSDIITYRILPELADGWEY